MMSFHFISRHIKNEKKLQMVWSNHMSSVVVEDIADDGVVPLYILS